MANSISTSLGILRSSGLAAADSYAVVNALSIIEQVFGQKVDSSLFLKSLNFPAICQQGGVIGGLLPTAYNEETKVITHTFSPLVKAAFKLVSPTMKQTKEKTNYNALLFIGEIPHPDVSEEDEDGNVAETSVALPNLLVSGKTFSAVNSAWDFESASAAEVFLAPTLSLPNGVYPVSRISTIKAGGAIVELDGQASVRVTEKNTGLLAIGTLVDAVDGVYKVGQETISAGVLTDLFNFEYAKDLVFLATSIERLGKSSLKFKSGDFEYWCPNVIKKLWVATAPNCPTEVLCEVTGIGERDGKKYPEIKIVYEKDTKYNAKRETATILTPAKAG